MILDPSFSWRDFSIRVMCMILFCQQVVMFLVCLLACLLFFATADCIFIFRAGKLRQITDFRKLRKIKKIIIPSAWGSGLPACRIISISYTIIRKHSRSLYLSVSSEYVILRCMSNVKQSMDLRGARCS